ncbi:MAG: hypothetical protein KDA24_23390 [Deltaproteobacteria bacterium]|nr:hypothetical protein [Deltaproteobacteria bacterium]
MSHGAGLLLLATLLTLGACKAPPVAATLLARPSGTYGEVISWATQAPPGTPRHRLDVEIEVDEAQLMGWSRSDWQYNMFVDLDVQGAGDVDEQWMKFPVTEEKVIHEDAEVRQIAYKAAGTPQPSGFLRSETLRGLYFKPDGGEVVITAHIRTPQGADRKVLKAVRNVRLLVRSGSDKALTGWEEQPRTTRD